MKKLSLKSKILLGAFLVGGLGAGATEVVSTVANAKQQQYNWVHYNQNGSPSGQTLNNATEATARETLGCPGTEQTLCARGTAGSSTVEIFYE